MPKETLTFELPQDLSQVTEHLGCIEELERLAQVEFSCGDGLFLSDLEDNPALFAAYDGKVDDSCVRLSDGRVHRNRWRVSFQYVDEAHLSGEPRIQRFKAQFLSR